MSQTLILQVAVPVPLYKTFDYLAPDGVAEEMLLAGVRVMVPFGRGSLCGLILEVKNETRWDPQRLKRVERVLDDAPLLSVRDLAFLQWAAGYYQHPPGEVLAGALPLRLRSGEPALTVREQGWRLSQAGRSVQIDTLQRAPRQRDLLTHFHAHPECQTRETIQQQCGDSPSALAALRDKGWIEPCELDAEEPWSSQAETTAAPQLNAEQQRAVEAVGETFAVYLLDGVTGSGKTEVYFKLIEKAIDRRRQVLVLVPEIGLTPQLVRRFRQRIGARIALLHSGLSKSERELAWHQARLGHAAVVIGTRSALFTPLPGLGLIIVDEEHDLSFKQQDGFRYSARDLAVVRGQQVDCPVILGSATPSLESLGNALRGRYQHLLLRERAGGAAPPGIDLLDIRSAPLDAGVSPTLLRFVREELAAGNQVMLFLNRRGYAPVVTCHDCGWLAQCRRCDARMTLHMGSRLLWCHHCGSQRRLDKRCPECGGEDLRPLGQGTERLEEMLRERLPQVALARIDRDATRRKGSLERLLSDIRKGKYSLLLGTQMLAKGHHFPDVTLVGILDVDQGLFGADYRAAERMAQLILQVAGRAGRAEKPGRVMIQTRHPDHPLLQMLIRRGYDAFAKEALEERREVGYPPFSHQALLRAEAPREDLPRRFLEEAVAAIGEADGVEVWGPVPAPMERRAGRYRAHLLLQAGERPRLHRLLTRWIPDLAELPSARRVRWSIDVDPQEMF